MDKFKFYDTQTVSETHLDGMSSDSQEAFDDSQRVPQVTGINIGITMSAHAADVGLGIVAELTVATGEAAYAPDGKRIVPTDGTLVQMFIDGDSNPIVPATSGNSKIHRVFMIHDEVGSVPALIPGNTTIDTRLSDGAVLYVRAGAEYTTGGTKVYPAKTANELIVADIEMDFGATEVLGGDIDHSFATRIYKTPGGTAAVSPNDFLVKYDTEIRIYIDDVATLFSFPYVTPDDLNLGSTIEGQIAPDSIHNTLGELMNQLQMNTSVGTNGTKFLGFHNQTQWVNGDYSVDSTNAASDPGAAARSISIDDGVREVIEGISSTGNNISGAHRTGFDTTGGITWKDGVDLTDAGRDSVWLMMKGLVEDDLASIDDNESGASKIGFQDEGVLGILWRDGTAFETATVTDVYEAFERVVDRLGDSAGVADGAIKIGYDPDTHEWADGTGLSTDNVADALDEIVDDLAGTTGIRKLGFVSTNFDFSITDVNEGVQGVLDDINDQFVMQQPRTFGVAPWQWADASPIDVGYYIHPLFSTPNRGNSSTSTNYLMVGSDASFFCVNGADYDDAGGTGQGDWTRQDDNVRPSFMGFDDGECFGIGNIGVGCIVKDLLLSPWESDEWADDNGAGFMITIDFGGSGVSNYDCGSHEWKVLYTGASVTFGIGGFARVETAADDVGGYCQYNATLSDVPTSISYFEDGGTIDFNMNTTASPTLRVRDGRGLVATHPSTAAGDAGWVGFATATSP
jgi:hypothetical protein